MVGEFLIWFDQPPFFTISPLYFAVILHLLVITPSNNFSGVSGSAAAALLQRLQGVKGLQGSMITTGAGGRPVLRLPLPNPSIRPQAQVRFSSYIYAAYICSSAYVFESCLVLKMLIMYYYSLVVFAVGRVVLKGCTQFPSTLRGI